jgi:hypothetical protein
MPTSSIARTSSFRNILARIGAALREQRELEARRAIRRYRHLLAPPSEAPPSEALPSEALPSEAATPYDTLVTSKEQSQHANGPDTHPSAPSDARLERA